MPPISFVSGGSIPGYHFPTKSKEELLDIISHKKVNNFERFEEINEAIYYSISHGQPAMLRFEHSWVLWVLSKWKGYTLRYTQNPQKIMMADAAICSQSARLLVSIAQGENIDARLVSLQGHVVAEVLLNGKWFIFDPDYGVAFPFDAIALSDEKNKLLVEKYLTQKGFPDTEVEIYKSVIYNNYTYRHPLWEAHEPKPDFIERWSIVLSWISPIIGIFLGFGLLIKLSKKDKKLAPCVD